MRLLHRLLPCLLFGVIACGAVEPPATQPGHRIWIHQGSLAVSVPASWTILAHHTQGPRNGVVFQLFDNPAEAGTPDSSNLAVTSYDLSDGQTMLAFVQSLTTQPAEGETESEWQGWVLRSFSGQQGQTTYAVVDARCTFTGKGIGVHVRLAWPKLAGNAADYDQVMEQRLQVLLAALQAQDPTPDPGAAADPAGTGQPPAPE